MGQSSVVVEEAAIAWNWDSIPPTLALTEKYRRAEISAVTNPAAIALAKALTLRRLLNP